MKTRDELLEGFATRLKMAMEVAGKGGVSQKEMAQRLGVAPPSVNAWFKGRNFPDVEHCIHICEWLRCDLTWLTTGIHGDSHSTLVNIWNQSSKKDREHFLKLLAQSSITQDIPN
jgi:transcriptional regulator with XRE-family HTH domain